MREPQRKQPQLRLLQRLVDDVTAVGQLRAKVMDACGARRAAAEQVRKQEVKTAWARVAKLPASSSSRVIAPHEHSSAVNDKTALSRSTSFHRLAYPAAAAPRSFLSSRSTRSNVVPVKRLTTSKSSGADST